MVCSISLSISLMFIIGMIYMNIMVYENKTIKNYRNQLSDDLKIKYDTIVKERTKINYQGYLLGFILSLFVILYNYKIKEEKLSLFNIICIVLASSFIVNYFYYTLYPKSNWMLDSISTRDEINAWTNMYKNMKNYYHGGLLMGLIAIIILAIAFRC